MLKMRVKYDGQKAEVVFKSTLEEISELIDLVCKYEQARWDLTEENR